MSKLLIDTNVCLDAALYRKPFASNALEILEWAQTNHSTGLVASHSFDTIFYFLRKKLAISKAYKGLSEIRKAFGVAPVTQLVIDRAIHANWHDFEDAIHYQAALEAGCDAIITRNTKDFKKSELPVLSPQAFLKQFG